MCRIFFFEPLNIKTKEKLFIPNHIKAHPNTGQGMRSPQNPLGEFEKCKSFARLGIFWQFFFFSPIETPVGDFGGSLQHVLRTSCSGFLGISTASF